MDMDIYWTKKELGLQYCKHMSHKKAQHWEGGYTLVHSKRNEFKTSDMHKGEEHHRTTKKELQVNINEK